MTLDDRFALRRLGVALVLASIVITSWSKPAPANGLDALSDAQSLFVDCSMHDRENRTVHENLMLLACRSVLHRAAMAQNWGPRALSESQFGWSWTLCPSRYHDFNRDNLPDIFVYYWLKHGVGDLEFLDAGSAAREAVLGHFAACFWTSDA